MKAMRHDRSGITSLITVMIVSVIVSIMVIGFVRIAIREQRQSTDNELSARALYAAEAGLEDALSLLQANPVISKTDCDPGPAGVLSDASKLDMAYTCLLIDSSSAPNYEAEVAKYRTVNIPLTTGGNPFNNISVEWHNKTADGANPSLRPTSNPDLLTESAWLSTSPPYPAMLRAYIFSYGATGITRNDLKAHAASAFLKPADNATSASISVLSQPSGNFGLINASCDRSRSDYICKMTISTDSTRNYVLRLTSLYASTHVRVSAFMNTTPVSLVGVQAIVDVTGQAGDVYRRIESRVDLSGSFADVLPDYAIVSADDICKDAEIPENNTTSGWEGLYRANDCL